jgi:oxygen-dependent protoporphyrinogen oxidase
MAGTGEQVVVVGAGIAGLACAFRLQRQGCQVQVLEQNGPERVGGRMAGIQRAGTAVDLGAPLLAARSHRMLQLIADVGLADQVFPAADWIGVASGGTVHRSRTGTPLRLLTGGLLRAVPVRDAVKVLADLRGVRRQLRTIGPHDLVDDDAETLTHYMRRRALAPRTLDLLLDPLNCTLTLAEPEGSSAAGALFFLAFLLGSGGLFTSAAGSVFLPRALARQVPVTYHARVTTVVSTAEEATVHWRGPGGAERAEHAQAVVLAVPADRIPELYDRLDPRLADLFATTRYSRLVQITFHLDRRTAERSVLFVLSRRDSPQWTSAVLQHNLAPGRVANQGGLVTCYLRATASEQYWGVDDTKIIDRILGTARRLRVLPELQNATTADVDRIDPCVVTRGPEDFARIAAAWAAPPTSHPVLLAGGDLYGYSTTIGSVKSGEQAAARILAKLRPEA